jgi:L-fucose isomerase-like protein
VTPTDSRARATPARFAWFEATSTIHDPAELREPLAAYRCALRELGGEPWDPPAGLPSAPLVIFVVTGGTERRILENADLGAGEPALLVAHPGHNSLPAALEVLARVQQLGGRGQIHYLRGPDDRDGLRELAGAVHDRAVRRALLASRIGLVGEPSDWLVASSPASETVRTTWGPTVVPLPLTRLTAALDAESAARGDAVAREFGAGAEAVAEAVAAALPAAGQVYAALRRLAEAERLDAVAVRCFDLIASRNTTGCLALAQLNDEGVVAGCEGDLVATVAMLWLRRLTGELPWMANPSRIDPERGRLILAHCTVPRGASRSYRLRSHFESGLGVGVQGALATGPVTLARLGGVRVERLWTSDGQLLCNTDHPDLCRTQVEVEIGREAARDLLARPLGNHLVMIPGHHAAALRRWHETMIG